MPEEWSNSGSEPRTIVQACEQGAHRGGPTRAECQRLGEMRRASTPSDGLAQGIRAQVMPGECPQQRASWCGLFKPKGEEDVILGGGCSLGSVCPQEVRRMSALKAPWGGLSEQGHGEKGIR